MTYLADLDISVLRAMREGAVVDDLMRQVNCAPMELQSTLSALRRLGLADLSRNVWQPTLSGRKLI